MKCPTCQARMRVTSTQTDDTYVLRYRKCPACEAKIKTIETGLFKQQEQTNVKRSHENES